MKYHILVFLILNFAALGIGSLFTSSGVPSDWYQALEKAPWTPPGWVFGTAWTTIMICFAVYMSVLWENTTAKKTVFTLFTLQWVLNVSWNPIFFHFHQMMTGLIIISFLTIIILIFLIKYMMQVRYYSLLIVPYFIWLLIASSLNAYILFRN